MDIDLEPKEALDQIMKLFGVEKIKAVFRYLELLLYNEEFQKANTFMQYFNQQYADISCMRIILVVTKHVKEHNVIKNTRASIKEILESKIGKIY